MRVPTVNQNSRTKMNFLVIQTNYTQVPDYQKATQGNSKKINCSEIYSIVLDTGFTSVNINGIDCITLGHGIQDDPVATHKFWGENILTILKKLPGWKKGFIELLPGCFTRCPDTGEVNGINCDKVITN